MGNKRKGQLTTDSEWHKHLRKIGKRFFWKGERNAEKKMIEQNLTELENPTLSESEIESYEKLYKFLNLKLQKPVNYEDLNNLCFSLFCTLEILPQNLQSLKITKKVLSKIFAQIASENNIEFNGLDNIAKENNWIDQIDKSMTLDKWPNIEKAGILLGRNK
jgi:hypothetical protein